MSVSWVWTVAGSDSSGGAGLQADLKTLQGMGVRGATVVSALTAQSLCRVRAVQAIGCDMLEAQWQALAAQGRPAAIKIGMLHDADQVRWLAGRLADWPEVPVVCDPVQLASDGSRLQQPSVREAFLRELLPRITLLTPNLPEAHGLLGSRLPADAGVAALAHALQAAGARAVLIKGGHADGTAAADYFCTPGDAFWLQQPRLPGFIHGSGCILAAAIAAALARGYALDDAVVLGRRYLHQGWRLATATGSADGWFVHAGWPDQACDVPALGDRPQPPEGRSGFAPMGVLPIGLYPVVDSVEWLQRLLPLGIHTLQLRIKSADTDALRSAIVQAVALGRRYGARIFINDHWALALEAGAYGVHLGQEDLATADLAALAAAGLRLGISNHSERELARALTLQPSYLALGPVFSTTTKAMRFAPQGLDRLREWVRLLSPVAPLVAIGGIDAERLPAVLATGVGNAAVVRAITEAADPLQATRALQRRIAGQRA